MHFRQTDGQTYRWQHKREMYSYINTERGQGFYSEIGHYVVKGQ